MQKALRGGSIRNGIILLLCCVCTAQAEELKIGGTGAALGAMQLLAAAYVKQHPEAQIRVLPSMGSGGGIKAVLSGAVQLGLSSRALTEAEIKAGASGVEYGRTPFVLATHVAAPVNKLSLQELVDIYAGKNAHWPDGTKIRPLLRPIGDSDSQLLKEISPAMPLALDLAAQRKGVAFAVTDQEAATLIEKIPGAIGPSTLAQIITEKRQIKPLILNDVAPAVATLRDGRYPWFKVLLVVSGPRTPPAASAFVAFVRSEAGRNILAQSGHWVQ